MKDLPRPLKERWQPLRSGIVNLYRYDYEEFWYENGHLLTGLDIHGLSSDVSMVKVMSTS